MTHGEKVFFKEHFHQLTQQMQKGFDIIHLTLNKIMSNQKDFDAKLAQLKPAIDQVKTDFEAFKAAAAAKGVDLSEESATLDASLGALADLHQEVATPADGGEGTGTDTSTSGT